MGNMNNIWTMRLFSIILLEMVLMPYVKLYNSGNFIFEIQWLENVNSWCNIIKEFEDRFSATVLTPSWNRAMCLQSTDYTWRLIPDRNCDNLCYLRCYLPPLIFCIAAGMNSHDMFSITACPPSS